MPSCLGFGCGFAGDSSALTVELADLEGCGVFLGDVSVVYCAFAILEDE